MRLARAWGLSPQAVLDMPMEMVYEMAEVLHDESIAMRRAQRSRR